MAAVGRALTAIRAAAVTTAVLLTAVAVVQYAEPAWESGAEASLLTGAAGALGLAGMLAGPHQRTRTRTRTTK